MGLNMPPVTAGTFVGGFYTTDIKRKFEAGQLIFSADDELNALSDDLIGATLGLFNAETDMTVCNVNTVILNSSADQILMQHTPEGSGLVWSTPLRFDYSFYTDDGQLDLPNTIKNIAQGVLMGGLQASYPGVEGTIEAGPFSVLHDIALYHHGDTGQVSVWLIHQVADGVQLKLQVPLEGDDLFIAGQWVPVNNMITTARGDGSDQTENDLMVIFDQLRKGNGVSTTPFSYTDLKAAYNDVLGQEAGPV